MQKEHSRNHKEKHGILKVFLIPIALALLSTPADCEEYLLYNEGQVVWNYHGHARLLLDFHGNYVSGTILPMKGINGEARYVYGENFEEGKMRLFLPNEEGILRPNIYEKEITRDKIIWKSETASNFFRLRSGPFSEASLTFSYGSCSVRTQLLQVFLNEDSENITPEIDSILRGKISEFTIMSSGGQIYLTTPLGEEARAAQLVRQINSVHSVSYFSGCGPEEATNFTLPKSVISEDSDISSSELADFLKEGVKTFLEANQGESDIRYKIDIIGVAESPFLGATVSARLSVTAWSRATRRADNNWDRFEVFAAVADISPQSVNETTIIIWVEDLYTGSVVARPNVDPPHESFLNILSGPGEEGIIALLLSDFFANEYSGRCSVEPLSVENYLEPERSIIFKDNFGRCPWNEAERGD
ncbi:hypothetical protein [Pseudoruegeria sp. HB172150]|uniref:hypothetical protein n=1 Tax=Pseudoruegeria sp. HB172150 TaxID=2721164 RepID=UPI001552F3E9|nr:hypothetical protein [Pseudoruegeria sp. HB172150]